IPQGNLCLVPQRLALELQLDGWIVRSIVIWHKPAPMPASLSGWRWVRCRVKVRSARITMGGTVDTQAAINRGAMIAAQGHPDRRPEGADCPGCKRCSAQGGLVLRKGWWRPTSAWEPILMLAKRRGYYADGEAVRTPPAEATVSRDQYTRVLDDPDEQFAVRHDHETYCTSGANARDVQSWSAEPLREKHYAAFPTALVAWCLRSGTSARGYCPLCGAPWARVMQTTPMWPGVGGG